MREELRKTEPRTPRRRRKQIETPRSDNNEGLLLPTPMSGWAENRCSRRSAKLFSLLTQERELSWEVVVEGSLVKVLIDTKRQHHY